MPSDLRIIEGSVSQNEEHIAISYGSVGTDETPFPTVARVSASRDGVIKLEFLIDDSTTRNSEIIANVRRKVRWLFLEKGEAKPWAYARYYCTTARPTSTVPFTGTGYPRRPALSAKVPRRTHTITP